MHKTPQGMLQPLHVLVSDHHGGGVNIIYFILYVNDYRGLRMHDQLLVSRVKIDILVIVK